MEEKTLIEQLEDRNLQLQARIDELEGEQPSLLSEDWKERIVAYASEYYYSKEWRGLNNDCWRNNYETHEAVPFDTILYAIEAGAEWMLSLLQTNTMSRTDLIIECYNLQAELQRLREHNAKPFTEDYPLKENAVYLIWWKEKTTYPNVSLAVYKEGELLDYETFFHAFAKTEIERIWEVER